MQLTHMCYDGLKDPHLSVLLHVQGVDHQLVHIDLADRPAWYTSLSGLVPLVEHRGEFYKESLDICR